MDEQRKAIRPEIHTMVEPENPAEKFQNEVLRPIMKMQNDLIVAIFRHFLRKRKVPFNGKSIEERKQWIAHSLSKDNRLRGMLLGAIIGHFTLEEYTFYLEQEGEMRRRITNLLTERLRSQMKELLA